MAQVTSPAGRSSSTLTQTHPTLAAAAFILLLISIIVGPVFTWSTPAADNLTGQGNAFRQIIYLGLFFCLIYASGGFGDLTRMLVVPASINALLLWCWISLTWALNADTGVRRLILTTLIIYMVFIAVRQLNLEKCFHYMRIVLGVTLALNLLTVALFPQIGIHQFEADIDPGLVGHWRGFLPEKNVAGALCAITILVFLFHQSRWPTLRFGTMALATLFLIETGSKTSLGICALAAVVGWSYRFYDQRYWPFGVIGLFSIIGGLAAFALVHLNDFQSELAQPDALTGRSQIWPVLIAYITDHPLLGTGYGSFWNIGEASPVFDYAKPGSWVQKISSGHNGYLDLTAQIGLPGLALAFYALIFQPLLNLLTKPVNSPSGPLLLAILLFCIGHNGTESTLMDRDHFIQFCLVLTLAMIQLATTKDSATVPN